MFAIGKTSQSASVKYSELIIQGWFRCDVFMRFTFTQQQLVTQVCLCCLLFCIVNGRQLVGNVLSYYWVMMTQIPQVTDML